MTDLFVWIGLTALSRTYFIDIKRCGTISHTECYLRVEMLKLRIDHMAHNELTNARDF